MTSSQPYLVHDAVNWCLTQSFPTPNTVIFVIAISLWSCVGYLWYQNRRKSTWGPPDCCILVDITYLIVHLRLSLIWYHTCAITSLLSHPSLFYRRAVSGGKWVSIKIPLRVWLWVLFPPWISQMGWISSAEIMWCWVNLHHQQGYSHIFPR